MDCSEDDLQVILNNTDYREDQYIDYKEAFAFLHISTQEKEKKKVELRNDICAFANADGGYLVFGVKEKGGIPTELQGIDINTNPERFEMNIRNSMTIIQPKVPPIHFKFIHLKSGKYIVILEIQHDFFSPYMHIEGEKNYKIYKREGVNKRIMRYTELKNMFMQSRTLEDEILVFRKKRIEYRMEEDGQERFVIFHIIPEYFLSEKKELFKMEYREDKNLGAVFNGTSVESISIPCVDGLRYISMQRKREGKIYNNGIIEFYYPLEQLADIVVNKEHKKIYIKGFAGQIVNVLHGFREYIPNIFGKQRYFGCISVIGCKGFCCDTDPNTNKETTIDRNRIICTPTVFTDICNDDVFFQEAKEMQLEVLLSLGMNNNKVKTLLRELV